MVSVETVIISAHSKSHQSTRQSEADCFFKYVAFCIGFNLLTSIYLLPYIIMDLPIYVIAEWATMLVDNSCPRGGS